MTTVVSPVQIAERAKLDIRSGDTVRVWQKIKEGDKFRLQAFEGMVLARKHGAEAGGTFTVRKVVDGIGVERVFPLYSPMIDSVEVLRRAKVRRAKLYFIRRKATKEVAKRLQSVLMAKEEKPKVTEAKAEEKKEESK